MKMRMKYKALQQVLGIAPISQVEMDGVIIKEISCLTQLSRQNNKK